MNLQGRQLQGKTLQLEGVTGLVMGKYSEDLEPTSLVKHVQLQPVGEFSQIREWQKDQWNQGVPSDLDDQSRKFGSDLV